MTATHSSPTPNLCYHCGLPIPKDVHITYPVLGETRSFCCHGCQLACQTIVEHGFEDFYRHREHEGGINAQVLPDILHNLSLYDRPEIQRSFVRTQGQYAQASLILENIRCAACLWLNEQHLRTLPGIIDVQLDYTTHQARVEWDTTQLQLSQILQAIAAIGYIAHPYDPVHREALLQTEKHRSLEKLLFAGLLGMQVMAFSIATYWMGGYNTQGELALWEIIGRWSTLIVTSVMLIYSASDFFVGAWHDCQQQKLGMDLPIVLGLVTAWLGSLWATITHGEHVYYDSIGMFIFFVLLARVFELKARLTASAQLDRLMRIIPQSITRIINAQQTEEVAIIDLAIGDHIQLLPGQTLPVDGTLLSPTARINEAQLTGEPLPIDKQAGDPLRAGSISIDQPIQMRVDHLSQDSTTAQLQSLIFKALATKPTLAQLADRIANPFIAIVLLTAFLTLCVWLYVDATQALPNLIAVLIITCPCALALATPVATAITMGNMSAHGMLPIHMSSLEKLPQTDVLVLDKTGTLTQGKPSLAETQLTGTHTLEEVLLIAHTLEQYSEHPLAHALKQANQQPNLPKMTQHKYYPSQGIEGVIHQQQWRIGNLSFCQTTPPTLAQQRWIDQQHAAGAIVLALSCNQQLSALFALQDTLRDDAIAFVQQMQQQQQRFKQVVILSGDHPHAVAHLAQQLNIYDYHGHYLPEDKLTWIQQRQQQGHRILMVGDGINDAPTLAAADVSVSFYQASDLAQQHSDLLLMGHTLDRIQLADQWIRKHQRIVKQNLFWALAYNLIAIPFAALGMITPWMAAIGMSVSSLWVVGNALRLRLTPTANITHINKIHAVDQHNTYQEKTAIYGAHQ